VRTSAYPRFLDGFKHLAPNPTAGSEASNVSVKRPVYLILDVRAHVTGFMVCVCVCVCVCVFHVTGFMVSLSLSLSLCGI